MIVPVVKRCVCAVTGFTFDPGGDQKPPNVFRKWSDTVRCVRQRILAPRESGLWSEGDEKEEERFRDRLVQARPDLEEKRTIQPRGGKIDLMERV